MRKWWVDWREEIWDKIWICGIFWGFWSGDLWGGGKLGGILKNLLVEGENWGFGFNLFSGDGVWLDWSGGCWGGIWYVLKWVAFGFGYINLIKWRIRVIKKPLGRGVIFYFYHIFLSNMDILMCLVYFYFVNFLI